MEAEVGIEPTLLRFCRPHPVPISRTRPSEDGACVAGIYSAVSVGLLLHCDLASLWLLVHG